MKWTNKHYAELCSKNNSRLKFHVNNEVDEDKFPSVWVTSPRANIEFKQAIQNMLAAAYTAGRESVIKDLRKQLKLSRHILGIDDIDDYF